MRWSVDRDVTRPHDWSVADDRDVTRIHDCSVDHDHDVTRSMTVQLTVDVTRKNGQLTMM